MTHVDVETQAMAIAILTRAAATAGPFPRDRAADELNAPMEARWLSYNAWSAHLRYSSDGRSQPDPG